MMNIFLPQVQSAHWDLSQQPFDFPSVIQLPSADFFHHLPNLADLAGEVESATGKRPSFNCAPALEYPAACRFKIDAAIADEGYLLAAKDGNILLQAAAMPGFFYGVQTLRQLLKGGNGYCHEVEIDDAPAFERRGFCLDVTRGKVPKLETLLALADKMAFYKLNELQLYIEHSFAFAAVPELSAATDPLTAEEILSLDDFCRKRHIDLVPSLSTFGHCYQLLRIPRLAHLNELELDGENEKFSFRDRMNHYTLDAANPGSAALIDDMLREFLPLFSSKQCNINCDETFDLGCGRNRGKDKLALYNSFLEKIIRSVEQLGKKAMFWGDIIGKSPEMLKKFPEAIPIYWNYNPTILEEELLPFEEAAQGRFYVAPGTCGWNFFLNNLNHASGNITAMARCGKKFHARGLLNTDWGDYGHLNLFGASLHGLALGAAAAWHPESTEKMDDFDAVFEKLEFDGAEICRSWRVLAGNIVLNWGCMALWCDSRYEHLVWNEPIDPALLQAKISLQQKALNEFRRHLYPSSADPLLKAELLWGAEGSVVNNQVIGAIRFPTLFSSSHAARELRGLEQRLGVLWHRRNKPSEYFRIRQTMLDIIEKLEKNNHV